MTQRMHVDDRKLQLLSCGAKLAERHGYAHITRKQIGDAAGVRESLVSRHFGTMGRYRNALMRHAIATKNVKLIAQGLIAKDRTARSATWELKQLALASITI